MRVCQVIKYLLLFFFTTFEWLPLLVSRSLSLESRSLALLSCCAASQADAFNSAINFQKIHIGVPTSLLTSWCWCYLLMPVGRLTWLHRNSFHSMTPQQCNETPTTPLKSVLHFIAYKCKKNVNREKNAKQQKTIYSHWRWRRRRGDVTTKGVLINI